VKAAEMAALLFALLALAHSSDALVFCSQQSSVYWLDSAPFAAL
jgi:hypothetical protein